MLNIEDIFLEHIKTINRTFDLIPTIKEIASKMSAYVINGGKVFWMGNGGSAADAQHLAAELIGRFTQERAAIPSLSLSTDSSILTCLPNDYDFAIIFERQLEALCQAGDVVVGLSTSGNSENVIRGIKTAKEKGAYTVGFAGGNGGKLKDLVDNCIIIPSNNTARIQEAHILIGHTLCQWIEAFVQKKSSIK